MAIKIIDKDLNIESYVKLSSVSINEAGTFEGERENENGEIEIVDTGVKKYNVVCNLDFYSSVNKEYIYKKTQISIDGIKEEECNLEFFYRNLIEKFEGAISI